MAYATQQDIIDRFGEAELIVAADHDEDGVADPDVVEQGLSDASDEIEVYLGERYTLPLNPVPPVLLRLCVVMALYHMSKPPAITDEKRRRYEDAVKLLTKISEGKVTLGEKDPAGTGNVGGSVFSANPRIFGRRGW
jgi:phage gp36-like protein